MKTRAYLVLDCAFNRVHSPRLVGEHFSTAPSYCAVRIVQADRTHVWRDFAAFVKTSAKFGREITP